MAVNAAPSALTTVMASQRFSQVIQELGGRLFAPSRSRPDQLVAVVLDDHGQLTVAALVRHRIYAKGPDAGEAIHLGLGVGTHPGDDPPEHPPPDPQ